MLKITGQFNGKSYNNDPIAPEELAKAFDLPQNGIYNLYMPEIPRDRFGQVKMPRSTGCPAVANVASKHGSFQLRYFTREVYNQGNNGPTYYPSDISVLGQPNYDESTYDLFVFTCLSGLVAGVADIQPKFGYIPYLHVYRPEVVREADNKRIGLTEDLMKQIMGMEDSALMIRARGMGIYGTSSAVRVALMQRITGNPTEFDAKFNSDGTEFLGLTLRAIDNGIIELKPIRSINTWCWNDGTEITRVLDGSNPQDSLMNHFSDPSYRSEAIHKIKKELTPPKPPVEVVDPELELSKTDFVSKIQGVLDEVDGMIVVKKNGKEYPITNVVAGEEFSVTLQNFFNERGNKTRFIHLTKA